MRRRLVQFLGSWFWLGAGLFVLTAGGIAYANYHIISANRARLYTDVAAVPASDVGLVLGASPTLRGGAPNLHFEYRMDAAAKLFHAGKVRHLLVSGDNRRVNYNEPVKMKAALVARGVPASAITCDYAGFRTLDSVVRAQRIFALSRCTIVTQEFHNSRALEIARARGLDAVGFCAPEPGWRLADPTEIREVLARTMTMLDLYVWHRQPHFLGAVEPIQIARN